MKDEVQRISKLVAEGKLSPEDAADLIEAFYKGSEANASAETAAEGETPPPPPSGDKSSTGFDKLISSIEKAAKDGNWTETAQQVREGAKKGLDALRGAIDDISKGKINFSIFANVETRDITLPLTVPEGKSLRIENPLGDVRVTGGAESGSVQAHAMFRGSTIDEAKARADGYTLVIEESDHQVVVRPPDSASTGVDLVIQVNGYPPVEIVSESGDVDVVDTRNSAKIDAKSGDIRLKGLNGLIDVDAQSGDVRIEDSESPSLTAESKSGDLWVTGFRGNLNARTASGDVTVEALGGKTFSIEAVSGDVSFGLAEGLQGSVNVRSVSGNAIVALASGGDYRVALSTLRGAAHCGLDLADEVKTEQRITGHVGEGTGSLDVSAVTGNVDVRLKPSA